MYVNPNYITKKALKAAVAVGKTVTIFQPGPFGKDPETYTGEFSVEGPHNNHRWYARVQAHKGIVTKVIQ